jgi:hypothetical protein
MGNGTTVEKMGISTGKQQGVIKNMDADFKNGCPTIDSEGIRTSANTASADSGGPHYAESESGSGVTILGLHIGTKELLNIGQTCDNDGISGNEEDMQATGIATPAYKMVSVDSLKFGY